MTIRQRMACLLACGALAACGSPMSGYTGHDPAMAYVPVAQAGVADGRAEFRALFCQVLESSPAPSQQACDHWLQRLPDEAAARPAAPVERQGTHYRLLIVTGVFAECLPGVPAFGDAIPRLQQLGYQTDYVPIRGRASAEWNADLIDNYLRDILSRDGASKFIVLAYSKGAVDTMTALDRHPALSDSIAGVISFAGAVNGSPLADQLQDFYRRVAAHIPLHDCPVTDGGELASITREYRLNWLAGHHPPAGTRYFSIVTTPVPARISTVFQPMYASLARIDPRNDGQVLHYDAILPGATLLGYVNADHFAVALPFSQHMPALSRTLIDKNDFPRPQLVEAAVLFVEHTLDAQARALQKKK